MTGIRPAQPKEEKLLIFKLNFWREPRTESETARLETKQAGSLHNTTSGVQSPQSKQNNLTGTEKLSGLCDLQRKSLIIDFERIASILGQ